MSSSVVTRKDRRSDRPTKKRALTPASSQAAEVSSLFAKPDQHVHIPLPVVEAAAAAARRVPAPPEIVTNVQGSSAGAGSGEFHVYKAARRREFERLRRMEEEDRTVCATEEFERSRAEIETRDEERTRKNREKREKARARKARVKKGQKVSRKDDPEEEDTMDMEASNGGMRGMKAPEKATTTRNGADAGAEEKEAGELSNPAGKDQKPGRGGENGHAETLAPMGITILDDD